MLLYLYITEHTYLYTMVFGLFKKKDPICGMKQEKGKGIEMYGNWFCNESCLRAYEKKMKSTSRKHSGSCCH